MGKLTRGQEAESNRDAEAQRETVQTCKPACGLCKSAKVWNENEKGVGVGVVEFKGRREAGDSNALSFQVAGGSRRWLVAEIRRVLEGAT